MDVNKLVKRIKQGDERAFDELYERMKKAVYYTAYAVLRDSFAAENVMQDAFVRFYRSLDSVDPRISAGSYLLTIARNAAINEYNGEKRSVSVSLETLDYLEARAPSETGIVDLAAKILDEKSFKVVVLCAIDGYKRREVAEMLEMPIGTVTWIYNKSIETLRQALEKEGL